MSRIGLFACYFIVERNIFSVVYFQSFPDELLLSTYSTGYHNEAMPTGKSGRST